MLGSKDFAVAGPGGAEPLGALGQALHRRSCCKCAHSNVVLRTAQYVLCGAHGPSSGPEPGSRVPNTMVCPLHCGGASGPWESVREARPWLCFVARFFFRPKQASFQLPWKCSQKSDQEATVTPRLQKRLAMQDGGELSFPGRPTVSKQSPHLVLHLTCFEQVNATLYFSRIKQEIEV